MKKIIAIFSLLLLSAPVFAWTIGPMNYQGRLLDDAGIPVTATLNFKVRIYDAASGGTLKFSEEQNSISVDDGVYSFLVSTGTNSTGAWDIALWNTPQLFLEIEVGGETLSPRHLMAATPYAYQANLALTTNTALALGNKTAAEYDSILEDICVSSKGKWLELANNNKGACLGVGSSFPGPAQVPYLDLTANGDFTNLDLSNADISGIQFDDATMTGTIFKGTTYSVGGMSGANLSNTVWDSATATDMYAYQVSSSTNLSGATLKNMDMSQWDLSQLAQAKVNGLSAAKLTSCTSGLPANWVCVSDESNFGAQLILLGPGVNLSATSAASTDNSGVNFLDLGPNVLMNKNLAGASFRGSRFLLQFFDGSDLSNADFSLVELPLPRFNNVNLTGAKFHHAKLKRLDFTGSTMVNTDFSFADINYAHFSDPATNLIFTGATVRNAEFEAVNNIIAMYTIFDNTNFSGLLSGSSIDFTGAAFVNGIVFSSLNDADAPNITFTGAMIAGYWMGDFIGTNLTGVNLTNAYASHLNICGATIPVTGTEPPFPELATVTWVGQTRCPNNMLLDSCNAVGPNGNTFANPTPVAQCNPAIP